MLIDAHCHINSLSGIKTNQVVSQGSSGRIFVDVSIDYETSLKSISLSKEYNFIYSSLGFHPFSAASFDEGTVSKYRELIKNNKAIVAIGEVGLDRYAEIDYDSQIVILSQFLELSKEFDLPIVVHNRYSDDSIFNVLDEYLPDYKKVIFHCFSQDKDFLAKILKKKGYASFSLNILRAKKTIIGALKEVPPESILLETDSPYMKIKGNYSSPLDIDAVYDFVAKERNISLIELCDVVCCNIKKLFAGIRI